MAPTDVTVDRPFAASTVLTDEGGGRFTAELGTLFSIGGKAHGGLLMVLLTKAALTRLNADHGGETELDPVVVGTEFLRAPELGTVELETDVLKLGRQASVAAARMTQDGRLLLSATVTAGALPDADPSWLGQAPPAPGAPAGADGL